jgi:hypothetical protein
MNEKFKDTDLREALRRNYANVPQLPEGGLSLRPLQGEKELKRRRFPFIWSGLGGGLSIAASILIAFLLWPKGDEAPITQPEIQQQPVVAEAQQLHEPQQAQQPSQPQQQPHNSYKSHKSLPQQYREPQQLAAEAQSTPLPDRATGVFRGTTECGSGPTKGSELPICDGGRLGESPQGESPLDEILPPERQALIDIYLAEEALQVAYKQQEQTQELRAFTARLQGKEPETSHLITAF